MVNKLTSYLANAAPAGVVLWIGGAAVPAFCRRMALHKADVTAAVLALGTQRPVWDQRLVTGGRGAVGRALCLRNRAMRPCLAPGLLRANGLERMADGTDVNRVLAGSEDALVADAGASAAGGLARSTRPAFRASPTQWGAPAPEPCENELPSHDQISFDCPFVSQRLYARTAGRGDKKLRL